jgi:hypothetical protein
MALLSRASKAWYARGNSPRIKLSQSLLAISKASMVTTFSAEMSNHPARTIRMAVAIKKLLNMLSNNCNALMRYLILSIT